MVFKYSKRFRFAPSFNHELLICVMFSHEAANLLIMYKIRNLGLMCTKSLDYVNNSKKRKQF